MIKIHNKKTKIRSKLTEQCKIEHCSDCDYKSFCFGCREDCNAKFCQFITNDDKCCNMNDCGIPCKIGLPYLLPKIDPKIFNENCNLNYNTFNSKSIVKIYSNVWGIKHDYLIDIRVIMGRRGFSNHYNIKERLNILEDDKLYLSFCVPDEYLDMFSDIPDRWNILKNFKFDGILSPNFSIYNNDPVCNRMYNEYRKREEIKLAIDNNINIYPELYLDNEHLDYYLKWVKNTNTNIVYVSFQKNGLNTKAKKWKEEMENLKYSANVLNNVKFIIIGAFGKNRYENIASIIPGAVFVDDITYRTTSKNNNHKENFKIAMKNYKIK
jgi:hypothetical protein